MSFFSNEAIAYQGPSSTAPLAFKQYNRDEVILGRRMRDWCKFSVCFWHTFRGTGSDPFGSATLQRPWATVDSIGDNSKILQDCKARVDAAFEFFVKLGVDYYT